MRLSALTVLLMAGAAGAQPLYGVDFSGLFYQINTTTGAASNAGYTGFPRLNCAAMNCAGEIYANRGRDAAIPTDTNKLIRIDRLTGAGTLVWDWGTANDLRGLAFADNDVLFAIRDNGTPDSLVRIDLATGIVTEIGPTGRGDLQGLTAAPGGRLLAVGISPAGMVYEVNPATGAAAAIGGSSLDNQAIEFASGNTVWIARTNLSVVDLTTGNTTIIGPLGLGINDLRGMAGFRPTCAAACYADCDGVGGLTANDFACFLTAYSSGLSYANCDGVGGLTANDFACFLNAYTSGCS